MQLAQPDWNPQLLEEVGLDTAQMAELGDLLNDFLTPFRECYLRSDQRQNGKVFVKGLLSDLESKSIELIALRYGESVRGLQLFMQEAPSDDVKMAQIYQQALSPRANAPQGMLSVDSTEFVKKGKHSVGVARQHCGRLGKTENCQSGVFVGYASEKGYGLVS